MKAKKSKRSMRARMERFAKTFWKKVRTATTRAYSRVKKTGRKINNLGNFAPTPVEDTKPSPARMTARIVLAVPRAASVVVSDLVRTAGYIITDLAHLAWGVTQAAGLALSTPYYLTYSPEYAKDNWREFWYEFSYKELRDHLREGGSPAVTVLEVDIPDVAVASNHSEPVDIRPEAQQPKGHPTPRQSDRKIEPYPFRPSYAEAI